MDFMTHGIEKGANAEYCPRNEVSMSGSLRQQRPGNPLAIVGFIFSLTVVGCVPGLVCGILGAARAKAGATCRGLAIAAIIIGAIPIAFLLLGRLYLMGANTFHWW